MAVNRTKVLEAAQKFLSKGQYDKAIAEYQKLVAEDPRDVRTLLKIGDLHTRRNKPRDAVDVYEKVAELYAKQGFFLKAVAVYKQILKLDAGHLSSTLKLAQMYEELALASDALTTYEQAADAFLAQGQTDKALETMQRMIALDGQNVAARIKYAEALSKADKPSDAAVAFAEGARLLREQGRIDDYIRVVERQLYHDPENVQIARELSGKYLERNDPKRALAKLQVCFKADPRDVQTLEMLAEAFRQLGQIPKTVSVLKEIARLHAEVNAEEPRRRTLLRVLDLDPNDAEARQALSTPVAAAPRTSPRSTQADARTAAPNAAAPTAAERRPERQAPRPEPVAPPPEEEEDELSLEDAEEDDDPLLMVAEDGGADEPEADLEDEPSVTGLLAEAEEYEDQGNYARAELALRNALLLDETHVEAHERLKDVYLATDRRVDAVRELLWLSEAADEQNAAQAHSYARAAFDLAPRAEATRRRLEALGLDPETGEPFSNTEEVVFVDDSPESGANAALSDDQSQEAEAFAAVSPATHGERPSVRAASSAAERTELDPLDVPMDPDDFDARVPSARLLPAPRRNLEELLDRPISADEFDAEPAQRTGGHHDVAALLEAPISPDEFDSMPPPRRPQHVASLGRGAHTDSVDDFGLSDDRFDRSDLHDVEPDPTASVPPLAQALHVVVEESYDELLSDDIDLARSTASTLAPGARELAPTLEDLAEAEVAASELPARSYQREGDSDWLGELPEPTLPAEPIPELIRRSSQKNLDAVGSGRQTVRPLAPLPAVPAAAQKLAPEIEEVLDEAEFFASQGMLDEALEVVQEATLIYPSSAALKTRIAEYEAAADARDAEAAAREEEPALDESFDIAEQLASELSAVPAPSGHDEMIDVESVFAQFKKGVAAQIAEDDTDTHFDLGIAYKEMGLIDDAIGEFEVSAKSPKRACTALTMVGMCHLEKGDALKAVSWFERALSQPFKAPSEELALGYEIANAYEASGQLEKALATFEKVAARDRTFRGVTGRVDQLKRRGIAAPVSRATR